MYFLWRNSDMCRITGLPDYFYLATIRGNGRTRDFEIETRSFEQAKTDAKGDCRPGETVINVVRRPGSKA